MRSIPRPVFVSGVLLLVLLVLNYLNIFSVNFALFFYFIMMLTGFTTFASVFGSRINSVLILSVLLFLSGIILILGEVFSFPLSAGQIITSLIIGTGIACLFVYTEDRKKTTYLYAGIIFLIVGFSVLYAKSSLSAADLQYWFREIIRKLWFVLLLLLMYVFYLYKK